MTALLPRSKTELWETPRWLFEEVSRYIGPFDLDAAAVRDNALCSRFYGPEEDGLARPWLPRTWCNPPYNEAALAAFTAKAWAETFRGVRSALLLPAKTDQAWFHDVVEPHARAVIFLRGRVKYELAGKSLGGAGFPSVLVVFGDVDERAIAHLRVALRRSR